MSNSDKGGKSFSKGKGHGQSPKVVCWKCNKPGHMAKECRARMIESNDGDGVADCYAASSSGANSSCASRVNHAPLPEPSSSSSDVPLVFNSSSCSDFSKLNIRMISEACSLDSCETFHDDTLNLLPGGAMMSDPLAGDLGSSDCVGPFNSCLHAGLAEYVECMTSSFELCAFCKCDDFSHFSSRVSAEYELSL